jgi:hypothetical protein
LNEDRFLLFNLEKDPAELYNLAQTRTDIRSALKDKLKSRLESSQALRDQILGVSASGKEVAEKKSTLMKIRKNV